MGVFIEFCSDQLDPKYEFSAPHFFDFCTDESEDQIRSMEKWFEIAAGYDPSPHAKTDGHNDEFDQVSSTDATEELHLKLLVRLDNNVATDTKLSDVDLTTPRRDDFVGTCEYTTSVSENILKERILVAGKRLRPQPPSVKKPLKRNAVKNKKIVTKQQAAQTPEGNARKKQKLDGGLQKQVHKYTPSLTVPRAFQLSTEKRAQMHQQKDYGSVSKMGELCSTFTSLAEQVQKFYLRTPERFKKPPALNKPKLTLSKPKEPELETSHRSRPPKVKSTAELEEEMLSKLQKFKARPANKKILEAPTLPALPRSIPQLPQFQEFNLKTMERAIQHVTQKASEQPVQLSQKKKKQRRKSFGDLQVSLRVKPRAKSTEELEEEEMAKMPKFKALPLNKKIFESRGDLGVFRHQKRQVTVPTEFNFATNERFHHQEDTLVESFRRLSLDSHPPAIGKTTAQSFHLLTEERGAAKMAKFVQELSKQILTESMQRIPKANLLPFTTDFPMVPPKPAQKPCTRPEPFQLESLLRHEQEVQRILDERVKAEKEKAELYKFRAQPVCSGPVFVPERSRKPLTEIKEFNFQVDVRAVQRAAYEKKMLEKQNKYKQLKEELEAARKEEEERFIKELRKGMIPQARPMPLFDKPFIPQRSLKTLTFPVSPQLSLPRKREGGPFAYQKFRMR